jgi:hypothetical protein
MENKRQVVASSFDHLFGPKDSSSSSSASSGIFESIFPHPSKVHFTTFFNLLHFYACVAGWGFALSPSAQQSVMTD